jgi:hypothetical protein
MLASLPALCECNLDPSARNAFKRRVPQPAPPGCGVSTSSTAETAAVFSPEGVNPQDVQKAKFRPLRNIPKLFVGASMSAAMRFGLFKHAIFFVNRTMRSVIHVPSKR